MPGFGAGDNQPRPCDPRIARRGEALGKSTRLVQAIGVAQAQQSPFAQLVRMARTQPEPQRLLFVFAGAELPTDATAQQREQFARGQGGALVPWMTVDKEPAELTTFEALADEATAMRSGWKAVFVAALSGRAGQAPRPSDIDVALDRMEDAIKLGRVQGFLVLDKNGEPLRLG
jgi:hypothetical protein